MNPTASRVLCLFLAAVFTLGAALHPATAEEAKKGKKGRKAKAGEETSQEGVPFKIKVGDLARVTYQAPGKVQSFAQVGPKLWATAGTRYDEIDRDEFSVLLIRVNTDEERVAIDLHTKEVKFLGKTVQAAYPILTAAPAQPK